MSRIRGRDTKPEMTVRRLIHGMGYRYRLHDRTLPGSPDIVFRKRKKVIFVHGCFWHRHKDCPSAVLPKTRRDFWTPKLNRNKKRDAKNLRELEKAGWSCLVLWECEIKNLADLPLRIQTFLEV